MLPGFRRRDLAHGRASEIFQETGITRCNVGRQYLEKHANRERDIIDTDNYSIGRRAEECFCGNRARGERGSIARCRKNRTRRYAAERPVIKITIHP